MLEPISTAEALYALPKSWAWVRVGDIFDYDAGAKRDPKELNQNLWLLELEDIEKDTSKVVERLRVSDRDSQSTKSEFEIGDILYGKLRPYLNKVVVADEPGYSTTEIIAIRPFLKLSSEYCALAFRRPDFVNYVERLGRGTKMPRLRTPDAIVAPFPLPPLTEQHRIVAKVDNLMGLCDQLEAARANREAVRDRLAGASLARLNAPDPETFQADGRFALDTLPALSKRSEQIKHLRQTILNLALRGALSQSTEKTMAAPCSNAVLNDPKPYAIGDGWRWVRMDEIVHFAGGSQPPKSTFIYGPREGYTRLVQIRDFKSDAHLTFVPTEKANRPFKKGDVMIGRYGPPVFQILRGLSGTYNVPLMKAEPIVPDLSNDFLFFLLQESRIHDEVVKESERTAGQTGVRLPLLNSFVVGLPPLAEQHRIVAKIDALMALCDQLEASLTATDAIRRRLLDALLAEALAPIDEHREMEAAE